MYLPEAKMNTYQTWFLETSGNYLGKITMVHVLHARRVGLG